jgi:hypothetical protein
MTGLFTQVGEDIPTGAQLGISPRDGKAYRLTSNNMGIGISGEHFQYGDWIRLSPKDYGVWVRAAKVTEINPEREKVRAELRDDLQSTIDENKKCLESYERTLARMGDLSTRHGLKDVINIVKAKVEAYEGFLASLKD